MRDHTANLKEEIAKRDATHAKPALMRKVDGLKSTVAKLTSEKATSLGQIEELQEQVSALKKQVGEIERGHDALERHLEEELERA